MSITRATKTAKSIKLETHLCFWDDQGGDANGNISIAILRT